MAYIFISEGVYSAKKIFDLFEMNGFFSEDVKKILKIGMENQLSYEDIQNILEKSELLGFHLISLFERFYTSHGGEDIVLGKNFYLIKKESLPIQEYTEEYLRNIAVQTGFLESLTFIQQLELN